MSDLKKYTDEELAVLLAEDSSAAFEEIFNRYWSKLYSSAFKRLNNQEVAQEIVQDLFTSLWIKRNALKLGSTLAAYLFTSIGYLVINYIRREALRRKYQNYLEFISLDDNSTEETIFHNDTNSSIEREISYLPTRCRSVFELSRKEFKTNKEIAKVLGISEKTVENQLTKALRRLRNGLAHSIGLCFIFIWQSFQ